MTPSLIIENGMLIDGTGRAPVAGVRIAIRDGCILSVDPGPAGDRIPGVTVIDLGVRTVIPGFFNTHVHRAYKEVNLRAWAQGGVTTVCDLGGSLRMEAFAERDRLNGYHRHARLLAAGPMTSAVRGYGTLDLLSPEDARVKISMLARSGADVIKIGIEEHLKFKRFKLPALELLRAVVETAHSFNLPVSAHITRAKHLPLAIEGGVDDMAHMAIDPVPEELLVEMVRRGIAWVPTLELWFGVSRMNGLSWDRQAAENLARFRALGGKVAMGTDYAGHGCPFDLGIPVTEIGLMQAAGLTPMEVILAGTRWAAEVCRLDDRLGTLEPGKIADLVVLDGNPLKDLGALGKIFAVIHGGTRIR